MSDICLLCNYLLELTVLDYDMIKYKPSEISLSSLYLALKICNQYDKIKFVFSDRYTYKDLKECISDILNLLKFSNSNKCNVKKKYLRKNNDYIKNIGKTIEKLFI